jgi:TctA family transporter
VLFPAILFFCCIGTYSINNSLDDIYTTAVFGFIGYLFLRLDMEAAPLLLGFILGPMLEENFRRAMLLSRGSFNVFVNRPISGTLLGVIGILVVWQVVVFVRKLIKSPDHHIHSDGAAPAAPAVPLPATGGK